MNNYKKYKNSFTGNVFIYASGASALDFPLIRLSNEKYIVVNGAVRTFIENKVKPFAYMFNDKGFLLGSFELVISAIEFSENIFMPEELYLEYLSGVKAIEKYKHKIYFIDRVNRLGGKKSLPDKLFFLLNLFNKSYSYNFSLFSSRRNRIGFSKDISEGYFCAKTIPYVGVQLAYFLGFNKVFLIGLDLKESVGRFYDKEQYLPTSLDEDYTKYIEPSFRIVAEHVIDKNFMLYNLSENSRLGGDIIKKIRFYELTGIINDK